MANLNGRKKKLLYLALCDPDLEVTGATVRMGAFVRHLGRYYDVTLVHMEGSGHRVAPSLEAASRKQDNHAGVVRRARIKFSRRGYFLFSPSLYRAAGALLKANNYDYLLADYGLAAVYGVLLSRRYGVSLIYSSHNVEYQMYQELSSRDWRRRLLARYVYWAEKAACRQARLVVAISAKDREHYAGWVPEDRIEVIPQGFDPESAHPFYDSPPPAPPVVLFIGSFRSENNRAAARRIVREIAPEVCRMRPEVRFQLIGAEPPGDLIGPNVECPGFVEDLVPYFRRANLVIAPMPFAHGMATKVVLALAFGKTVLATAEAAAGFPAAPRQLVVAPAEAFARTIAQLLEVRPAVDASGFADLREEFGWPSLIARLARRMEERCSQREGRKAERESPWR